MGWDIKDFREQVMNKRDFIILAIGFWILNRKIILFRVLIKNIAGRYVRSSWMPFACVWGCYPSTDHLRSQTTARGLKLDLTYQPAII